MDKAVKAYMKILHVVKRDTTGEEICKALGDLKIVCPELTDWTVVIHIADRDVLRQNAAFRLAESMVPDGTVYVYYHSRSSTANPVVVPDVKNVVLKGDCELVYTCGAKVNTFHCESYCNLYALQSSLVRVRGPCQLFGYYHPELEVFEGLQLQFFRRVSSSWPLGGTEVEIPDCPRLRVYKARQVLMHPVLMPSLDHVVCHDAADLAGNISYDFSTFSVRCPCDSLDSQHQLRQTINLESMRHAALHAADFVMEDCARCRNQVDAFVKQLNSLRKNSGKKPLRRVAWSSRICMSCRIRSELSESNPET